LVVTKGEGERLFTGNHKVAGLLLEFTDLVFVYLSTVPLISNSPIVALRTRRTGNNNAELL